LKKLNNCRRSGQGADVSPVEIPRWCSGAWAKAPIGRLTRLV